MLQVKTQSLLFSALVFLQCLHLDKETFYLDRQIDMFSRGLILQVTQNLSLLMTATKIIYGQYLQETNTR